MRKPVVNRKTQHVRKSIKATHLAAINRSAVVKGTINRHAAETKAALRRLAAGQGVNLQKAALDLLDDLSTKSERLIDQLVRDQARISFNAARAALLRVMPQIAVPRFDVVKPAEPLAIQPPGVVPRPEEKKTNYIGPIGVIAGLMMAGIASYMAGNRAGLTTAEMAVDRLAGRAKTAAQATNVFVSNRAVVAAVEVAHAVPVARRIPFGKLIPVAKQIVVPPPIPPTDTNPFVGGPKGFVPKTPAGPPAKPVPAPIPLPVIPPRNRPAPGEPEFVILPDPFPSPVAGPDGKIPPTDPQPPSPIRTTPELIGWQIVSALKETTRPKHRERHLTIYYYVPRPERGEKGLDDMPNPPYESPNDGGVIAWNCLCTLAPVFARKEDLPDGMP